MIENKTFFSNEKDTILINTDCYLYLPTFEDNSFHLILVDLPYIISKTNGFSNGGSWNNAEDKRKRKTPPKTNFGEWDFKPLDLDTLMKEFHRILKPNGTIIVFYDLFKMQELKFYAEKNKFKQPRLCIWQKTNPVPLNSSLNYLSNAREGFMTFVKKGKPTFNSKYDNGFYSYPICSTKERNGHATAKPLKLIMDLVEKHSNKGDLVLDCFMGGNSTGEASYILGRAFTGIEKEVDIFIKAVERAKRYLGENNE